MRRIYFLFFLFSFMPLSHAQKDARQVKINTTRPLRLDYLAPSWNKNPDVAETTSVILRDAQTGQLAKIEMVETGPDTGLFEGTYHINFQNGQGPKEVTAEIYVVPRQLVNDNSGLKKVDRMIKDGTILRKPYFLRYEGGEQRISVYDTREQAFDAYKLFLKSGTSRPPVERSTLEAQQLAEKTAEQKRLAELAAKAKSAREKMEALERKKREDLQRQQDELAEAEKARRKQQAKKLGDEAMKHYQRGEYLEAEKKFSRAYELDPKNDQHFYQYGVTLYRTEQYNRAVVILDLAKVPAESEAERDYIKGLALMKLKENDSAKEAFQKVKEKNDPALSPSAGFMIGIIEFQKENYDAAKAQFEYVLDQSKDPKLDQQAEAYIEQIANIKLFQAKKARPWTLSAFGGLMYDSNILSTSAALYPTDLAGWRWMYGASAQYRMIYQERREWAAALNYSDMYSLDKNFTPSTTFQNTDPLSLTLYFPHKLKGTTFGKPSQWTINPGYESIYMNADGVGARENIITSMVLKNELALVMTDDWFSNYNLELRQDTSYVDTTDINNQSATKVTLGTSQTWFQDKKKSEAWIMEAGLTWNQAMGTDQRYQRYDLAGSYMQPWKWNTITTTRVGTYISNYPQHSTGRSDTDLALAFSLQKPFTQSLTGILNMSYQNNNSSYSPYKYDKYVIMTMLNWTADF